MFNALLAHISRYVQLDETEENIVSESIKLLQLQKKELLLEEGKVCRGNYFVVSGCLRMYFFNDNGKEQTIQFAIENWWISDYSSLESRLPSGFYLQAVEASQVILLEQKAQDSLFDKVPKLERYFRLISQRMYAATQFRTKLNHTLSKEAQYQHFITMYPQFAQRIPQYMLASYLGFTPEFMSKIRAKKQKSIS